MSRARFKALWERSLRVGKAADADAVFDGIVSRYRGTHRHYHTCDHIDHCLTEVDRALGLMDAPDAVEMAIWFHDYVYKVPAVENELRSAEYFVELTRHRVDSAFSQSVYDMILATTHKEVPRKLDERYVVDVDLSSFGLPWEAFKRDSEAVRAEFKHLSDAEFYPGHMKFMQSLLDRKFFFSTEFFRDAYEETARENVESLMADLRAAGY